MTQKIKQAALDPRAAVVVQHKGTAYETTVAELDNRYGLNKTSGSNVMSQQLAQSSLGAQDTIRVKQNGSFYDLPIAELDARYVSNKPLSAIAIWDKHIPSSYKFRGARTLLGGAQNDSFQRATVTNDPFSFQGTGTSKFFVAYWMRINVLSPVGLDSGIIIGMFNGSGSNVFGWGQRMRTSGSVFGTDWFFGTGTGSAFVTTANYASFFNPSTTAQLIQLWTLVGFAYDGTSHGGTDSAVLQASINNTALTITGSNSLPQQIANPAAANLFGLGIPFGGNARLPFSFSDVAVCASVPTSFSAAMNDLWNNGRGRGLENWPASCPTPIAYYKGDEGATGQGGLPSGNLVNAANPGTYDLTATNSPSSELEIESFTDTVGGRRFVFGWTPASPDGQRIYEGIYQPNAADPIFLHPASANGTYGAAYARAEWPSAHLDLGSSGSIIVSVTPNTQANGADMPVVFFCDDQTNNGNPNLGTARRLGISLVCYNPFLNAGLAANIAASGTCTMTNASPCVVTKAAHGFIAGDPVYFTTSDTLPIGLLPYAPGTLDWSPKSSWRVYQVATAGLTTNSFQLIDFNNLAVNTSSAGSGTHTVHLCRSGAGTQAEASLWMQNGIGNPIAFANPVQARFGDIDGIEVSGLPIPANTYINLDGSTTYVIEVTNNGNGQSAAYGLGNNGAYELFVSTPGTVSGKPKQVGFHDDGQSGAAGNAWGATFPNLNSLYLNAYAEISTSGVLNISSGDRASFGTLAILAAPGVSDREQMRAYVAT